MALDLKTFECKGNAARLAALLTAVGYPFYFNGTDIEITCEKWFLENLKKEDSKLFKNLEIKEIESKNEEDEGKY